MNKLSVTLKDDNGRDCSIENIRIALGPFWVWMFLNESISKNTFLGGIIVMVSVRLYSFIEVYNSKLKIKKS